MTSFILFPTHLFEDISALKNASKIYLIEHPIFFGFREKKLDFNKKKLILHRASMKFYEDYLKKNTSAKIIYKDFKEIKKNGMLKGVSKEIAYYKTIDYLLDAELEKECKKYKIEADVLEPLNFLTTDEEFEEYYETVKDKKKPFFQTTFYKWQRERLDILIKNGKPEGGKWTFDNENRKPLPKNIELPDVKIPRQDRYVKEAIEYVEGNFGGNCGEVENFWCPIDFTNAKTWLTHFLEQRFNKFGTYEDAITERPEPFLFHSGISSSINIGILDPKFVIDKAIEYGKKHKIGMNNIEGFVRQILGWREFSRFTYKYIYEEMTTINYFGAKARIGKSFYDGTTGMLPLDHTIKKAFKNGYIHHIERLMIMGCLMMMMGIYPRDVYEWFMEFAVDSYDWVMVNNVYSMALYSDGGLTTSKAYAASSNYEMIRKSDYEKGEWEDIWNALYWNFIGEHLEKMRKMGRFGPIQAKNWERKKDKEKDKYRGIAKEFIERNCK